MVLWKSVARGFSDVSIFNLNMFLPLGKEINSGWKFPLQLIMALSSTVCNAVEVDPNESLIVMNFVRISYISLVPLLLALNRIYICWKSACSFIVLALWASNCPKSTAKTLASQLQTSYGVWINFKYSRKIALQIQPSYTIVAILWLNTCSKLTMKTLKQCLHTFS